MIRGYAIAIEGLSDLENLDSLTPEIVRAASMAINRTADRARTASARQMQRQVAFPATYLRGSTSRLNVTKRASPESLEAVITGRHRATSLARFVKGKAAGGGIRVEVKPGRSRTIKNAFLMPLKSDNEPGGVLGNKGLAVRVPKGQRPPRAYKPLKIADGLFLLYGPSVDQVFKTVREDVMPESESFLAQEFYRLLELRI